MIVPKIKLAHGVKVAVIGDIHEHEHQFDQLVEKIKPSSDILLVSVGDIYDKGFGIKTAESIINKFKNTPNSFMIRGNHELKHLRWARKDPNLMTEALSWVALLPTVLCFEFSNGSLLTIVHGGVTPLHHWGNLDSIETCYVRTVDEEGKAIPLIWKEENGEKQLVEKKKGTNWHDKYDGRFGYIISGHAAQKDGIPKFYNYSCNIDTACYETGIMTSVIYGQNGREDLITVQGEAAKPDGKFI